MNNSNAVSVFLVEPLALCDSEEITQSGQTHNSPLPFSSHPPTVSSSMANSTFINLVASAAGKGFQLFKGSQLSSVELLPNIVAEFIGASKEPQVGP